VVAREPDRRVVDPRTDVVDAHGGCPLTLERASMMLHVVEPRKRCWERGTAARSAVGVRQRAAPECGWLFVDATRNRSYRWCGPRECGNRDKVRRSRDVGRVITARAPLDSAVRRA